MGYRRIHLIGMMLLAAWGGGLFFSPQGGNAAEVTSRLQEMEVLGVAEDPTSGQLVVFLRGKANRRDLTMYIGPFEAQSISIPLQRLRPPRPLTHDLMLSLLTHLNATLTRVVITEIKDNAYLANIYLKGGSGEVAVDSRPSDAIALALRAHVPILADERVLTESSGKEETF